MARAARSAINSSATHVFEVLRSISRMEEPLGVSEISRRLGLPASTVYRALVTLEESDYIARFQNNPQYELGPMPQLLNRALLHRFKLQGASRPVLRELARLTGETSTFSVRLGWYAVGLAGVFGTHDIYHRDRLGEVALLHRNLAGGGMLAFLSPEEFERYRVFVERHHRDQVPESWTALQDRLGPDRANGFATEAVDAAGGLFSLSVPVRGASGEIAGSITVRGPVKDPQVGTSDHPWMQAASELESCIAAAPDDYVSPFAHLDADDIILSLGPE